MSKQSESSNRSILIVGDAIAILVTVVLGFVNHNSEDSFLTRFSFTFFPWLLSWILVGWRMAQFELPLANWRRMVSGVLWAMFFASPLAALLRAAWLESTALPAFALVMWLSTALGLIVWRTIYLRFFNEEIKN